MRITEQWVIIMLGTKPYSSYAKAAMVQYSKQIKLGRQQRKWSGSELAKRLGVSRATVQKIERGDMTCPIGLVLEAATLVGGSLIDPDPDILAQQIEQSQGKGNLPPEQNWD